MPVPPSAAQLAPARSAVRGPALPRPRPAVAQLALLLAGLGLGATVGVTLTAETRTELAAPGGLATFAGNLTGLVGTYLALLMVLLVSRIPPVERVLGQDGLLRWHRRLAPWPLSLIAAHALLLTVGFAQAGHTTLARQLGDFLASYPDLLAATVGLALMLLAGVTSVRAIRSRLRRETWWVIHLYLYLALALSFAHVIVLGPSFVGHPLTRAVWSLAWLCTAGLVLAYRIGLPLARSLRHRLQVVEVRREAPGVVSVTCAGRQVERLRVNGGQFFAWRFLVRGLWWQAHPYSLSSLPRAPYLRLTVKEQGDHSGAVARLRPGTRVAIEGPYGAFTHHAQRRRKVALLAGGIGVTALRALLEDLPKASRPVVVLRAARAEELALREEVAELVHHRRGTLHELVGSREDHPVHAAGLAQLVPDIGERDVYVCGPQSFVTDVVTAARDLGVPKEALHYEVFSW